MRRRRQRIATTVQGRVNQITGVSRARTQGARSANTRTGTSNALSGAVNSRFTSNVNARGAAVYSRRTGARVGTMVRNGG